MLKKQHIVEKSKVEALKRYDDVWETVRFGEITLVSKSENEFQFSATNGILLKIRWCSNQIVRIHYQHSLTPERDFSYAIDPNFQFIGAKVAFEENEEYFIMRSELLSIWISKVNGTLQFIDSNDNLIREEVQPFEYTSTLLLGTKEIKIAAQAPGEEAFYALGDKSGKLDLRGQSLQNWCTDAFAYSASTDPLYRAIPFYITAAKTYNYGIFLDNTAATEFKFASENSKGVEIKAEAGEMNYYFIYDETSIDVCKQYTKLTGTPELAPMWAFGFHQCRWSYYPEDRVRTITKTFRELQIPCDAIYLDIDYMEEYKCFTINSSHFPDLKKLVSNLKTDGFETIVMINPGIRVDQTYEVYRDGIEKDVFCRRFSGELKVAPVWPSACVFPDFTKATVREWWGELYRDLYDHNDISGCWNDMNEPAIFNVHKMTFADDVRHDYDGFPTNHRRAHNIYGMQMSRATHEGLKKIKSHRRPFLLTRASFSGGQRFAAIWTGDNLATWEHLRLANIQMQRLSLSGYSFCGSDIGGFAGIPSAELMIRWLQLAVFHPLMRIHSMGNNAEGAASVDHQAVTQAESENRLDQEPWTFGKKYTPLAKKAIEMRYRLLPYLYDAFHQYVEEGTPIIKSAAVLFPEMKGNEREFLFGNNIWVSPVEQRGAKYQQIPFPEGIWFDFETNETFSEQCNYKLSLQHIPVFVRAGTLLPLSPIRQHSKQKIEKMHWNIYLGPKSFETKIYEDEGEGYGESLQRLVSITEKPDSIIIQQTKTGKYIVDYKLIELCIIGKGQVVKRIIAEDFSQIEVSLV